MKNISSSLTVLRLIGAIFAIAVVGDALVQALFHLRDLSQINHIAGIWMTLAQTLRDGILYPPLEQDGHYAGTRYMPLFFVLIAGLAKLTGDYLLAAKLASFISMIGLLTAVCMAGRRITGRYVDAFILVGAVLVFPEARRALMSPHADALAVALAVAGLALVAGERRGIGVLAAAACLFALSFGAKFSSVAACAAACLYLCFRDWRSGVWLGILTAVLAAAGLGFLQWWSEGRFLDNFRALGSGGMSFATLSNGPGRLIQALALSTRLTFVAPLLLPPAVFALVQNAHEKRFSIWDWYFLFTVATTLFIFTSPGTDVNHLLELEVAAVLVLASWLRRQVAEKETGPAWTELAASGLLAVSLLFGLVHAAYEWHLGPTPDAIPAHTLTDALPREGQILTEDATVAVLRGRRPVLMDAFAFRLLAERGRLDPQPLADRVQQREFADLVLIRRIEDENTTLSPHLHFGPLVTDAIRAAYRFDKQIGGYYLYKPR